MSRSEPIQLARGGPGDLGAARAQRERLRRAAASFEGEFYRLALAAMRRGVTKSGLFGKGGVESEIWESFLDQGLAEAAGRRSSLGLAGLVLESVAPRAAGAAAAAGANEPLPAASLDAGTLGRLRDHDAPVKRAARDHDLDPNLVRAVMVVESGARPLARSAQGALGLMQLMPVTARELGVKDPWDADENVNAGALYLRQLLDRFGGNLALALASYNTGPNVVERHGQVPPLGETRRYVRHVLELREALGKVFPQE